MDEPAPSRPESLPWWDRTAFALFVGAIVWAPVPLGSNRPWALALLAMVLWAAVVLHLAGATWTGQSRVGARLLHASPALLPAAAFSLLVAAQLAGSLHSMPLQTIDEFQSRIYLLGALAYLAAAILVGISCSIAKRATWILGAVVAAGLLQALLAVALQSSGASYLYLFVEFDGGGRASGTFPNPDHLAGYMELCLSAGLGLMLAQFGSDGAGEARNWQQRLLRTLNFVMSRKMILRLVLVVMVVALVMTRSRAGNGAFFLAMLLVGTLVAWQSKVLRRPALWLVGSMAVVDILIIGQWVGLDRVVERMQGTAQATAAQAGAQSLSELLLVPYHEESIQQRMQVPRLSLPLVQERPWFGHGGGTYFLSFPRIKPPGFPHHWDHAHNDYVELAVDTGLVGLGLWLALALATAWRAAQMLRDSEPRLKRGVAASALMALTCMGLHSLVDFNLQIPVNAMTFTVLLMLVWTMPRRSSPRTGGMSRAGSSLSAF